jgi:hypothetical protein
MRKRIHEDSEEHFYLNNKAGGSMRTFAQTFQRTSLWLVVLLLVAGGTAFAQVPVSLPNLTAQPGATVTIPVTVGSLTASNIGSYDFEVSCDTTILRFTGADGSGTLSNGLFVVANNSVSPYGPGKMKVVCASGTAILGSGVLVNLTAVAQTKLATTSLQFSNVHLYPVGGFISVALTLTPGSVRVKGVNHAPTLTAITAKSVAEGALLNFTATATDADLPNDTLTYSLKSPPTGATIGNRTGIFDWTPTFGQAGVYPVTVKVTDLDGAADSTVVSITVTHTNRKPTFVSKMRDTTISDITLYTFAYAATDPDAGTTLTYKLESGPTGASVSSSGLFSWTPTAVQLGAFNVVASVSDGSLADTAKSAITVIHVNHKPSFVSKLRDTTINEGTTLTFSYLATDPDAGSTVTYSLVNAPSGAIISASGALIFVPPANPAGSYVITAVASDGSLADTAKATVSVNRKPVNVSRTPSTVSLVSRNVATTFTVVASDPDGNTLTFTWKVNGVTEKTGDNTFTRTFTDAQGTPKTVTAIFADAGGLKDSTVWSFSITPVEGTEFIPTEYALGQNYPNPFNPSTTIRFDLPKEGVVTMEIFNVLGVRVRSLVSGVTFNAGTFMITWDGRDDRGQVVPSGIYLYRISTGDFHAAKRMTLLK